MRWATASDTGNPMYWRIGKGPIATNPRLRLVPAAARITRSGAKPAESEQAPELDIGKALKLPTTPAVSTTMGTRHPSIPEGTWKLIWSRPEQQLDLPAYCAFTGGKLPTKICGENRLSTGGLLDSSVGIAPSPVPHRITTSPGLAGWAAVFKT